MTEFDAEMEGQDSKLQDVLSYRQKSVSTVLNLINMAYYSNASTYMRVFWHGALLSDPALTLFFIWSDITHLIFVKCDALHECGFSTGSGSEGFSVCIY